MSKKTKFKLLEHTESTSGTGPDVEFHRQGVKAPELSPAEEYFGVKVPDGWREVEPKMMAEAGDMCLDKETGTFSQVAPALVGKPWCWFNLLIRRLPA